MATSEAKSSIVIREITSLSEMRQVEELQKEVWGIADLEVFPALALIPMREVGAVLIGAFDGEQMIGFVFGFPGQELRHSAGGSGRLILHSDMLAVRPECRVHGLGYKLKLAQRERALANGIDTITWTFDPLQSLNAHLNFGKLGVVADHYRINYYGETTSFLHQTGTDRLWVTWQLNSQRVRDRIENGTARAVLSDEVPRVLRVSGEDEPASLATDTKSESVLAVEIPMDINRILRLNAELAGRWRAATRSAFTGLLAAGFVVTDFCLGQGQEGRVGRYRLAKTK